MASGRVKPPNVEQPNSPCAPIRDNVTNRGLIPFAVLPAPLALAGAITRARVRFQPSILRYGKYIIANLRVSSVAKRSNGIAGGKGAPGIAAGADGNSPIRR